MDQDIALRNAKNELLAVMTLTEMYEWDRDEMAQKALGSRDPRHPLVAEMHRWGRLNISGPLRVLHLPPHYDFHDIRLTPAQTRARLATFGYQNVVAFQTRNPLHRVHEELTKRAAQEVDGVLLLHPSVGMTKPGDVDHLFLTSLIDRKGMLRVQYLGYRFDPDEMLRDLRALLRE